MAVVSLLNWLRATHSGVGYQFNLNQLTGPVDGRDKAGNPSLDVA